MRPAPPPLQQYPVLRDGRSSKASTWSKAIICVAHVARRISSKLWRGAKDEEDLGFWAPSWESRFDLCASEGATGASIRDSENSKYCSSGDLPYRGEPDVLICKIVVRNYAS